ncbi:Vacuolar protein-sorting-associated protein 24 [Polyrhizophydium stewartii]|uniref:Vacuolar protein-sorting-associated protein 24 n=1 Tax=Polyrhizophydium stewartii TaxID=2732419 RepID=A0ABR4NCG3_9FUNG|nr:Charged multivesicular body protein 3 [Polyrhizophydium stewartii]
MSQILDMIIGKRLSPEDLVKKWRQSIRTQQRELDKSIRGIETEETKAKRLLKDAAKRNDTASCKMLAREIVHSRKVKDRLHTSKAQLNSLIMSMQQQLAVVKVTGALQKSGEIMGMVNSLIKLPEISASMQEMAREMMKAGIIEEMISDTLEMDDEAIEEEADEEVDKVITEITAGLLGQAGAVGADLPKEKVKQKVKEDDDMAARLSALKAV